MSCDPNAAALSTTVQHVEETLLHIQPVAPKMLLDAKKAGDIRLFLCLPKKSSGKNG